MEQSDSQKDFEFGNAVAKAAEFGIDLAQLDASLAMTPLERLIVNDQALELMLAMKDAGIQYYGFDPGPSEAVVQT